MTSNNPFLKSKQLTKAQENVVDSEQTSSVIIRDSSVMTLKGVVEKTSILFILLVLSSALTWQLVASGSMNPMPLMIGGMIGGLILVLISSFRPHTSGYVGPMYALIQGLFIGSVSLFFESMFPGIVINAVAATLITFMICLGLYHYKIVKVTEKFKSVVIASTLAIFTYYLITWLLSMFTSFQPVHYGNSWLSIGISVFVIVIAALNIFLDFDQIERSLAHRQPKYMEWFCGIGLMVTLVWLYIEFLRLLSKLSSRD